MELLERDAQLAQLKDTYRRVQEGPCGACVLVAGEAGIGKTALVQAFVDTLAADAAAWVAGCEALYTPRPLGPLIDLAHRFPPSVVAALHEGRTYNGLFPALLAHLAQARRPQVLVIEDVHWADAGTLDFVRYAGRRLREVRAMLVLTYRSDELEAEHPLRNVLGDLPAATTQRITVPALSRQAVGVLARASRHATERVFEVTGGNPFYLTEVLASPDAGVPPSVSDAVLARLNRLPAPARQMALQVSLFPRQAERALLDAVARPEPRDVDACLDSGLLHAAHDTLAFRHELARIAVYESMRPHQRQAGHRAIFAALEALPAAPAALARRVHHAEAGGLADAVARLAPAAAREAAASGAHREAARLYGLGLKYGHSMPDTLRAELLEARAHECVLTNQPDRSLRARREALALRLAMGDTLAVGANQRWLARLQWLLGGADAVAFAHAHAAIATLEPLPPCRELAAAYSTLSHLCLVSEDMAGAREWGTRAITLAEALHDPEPLSHALNNVGCARLRQARDPAAWQMIERSLALALEHRLETDAARAYNNLLVVSLMQQDYARGLAHAEQGIAFSEAKGLDIFTVRFRIRRSFAYVQTGLWQRADEELALLTQQHTLSPLEAAIFALVRGILELRRGVAGAEVRLLAALDGMQPHRGQIWFTSMAAARAEAAWLRGDMAGVALAVAAPLAQALARGDPWHAAELAAWLKRAKGELRHGPLPIDTAFASEAAGNWRAAAAAWQGLGCPYNRALALTQGDEPALREALAVFEALGAGAATDAVRRELRDRGARGVPQGPRPRTRQDPLGLTAREREVFTLLLQGLSNAAIAARLHRSERTVENHVAGVFAKLGVNTRAQLLAGFAGEPGTSRKNAK